MPADHGVTHQPGRDAYAAAMAKQATRRHIDRLIDNIRARGRPMSKLKALPALVRGTMADLEADAGKLTDRLNAVKARGSEAFDKWHAELDATETAVRDAESIVNQLSNGGPPLER